MNRLLQQRLLRHAEFPQLSDMHGRPIRSHISAPIAPLAQTAAQFAPALVSDETQPVASTVFPSENFAASQPEFESDAIALPTGLVTDLPMPAPLEVESGDALQSVIFDNDEHATSADVAVKGNPSNSLLAPQETPALPDSPAPTLSEQPKQPDPARIFVRREAMRELRELGVKVNARLNNHDLQAQLESIRAERRKPQASDEPAPTQNLALETSALTPEEAVATALLEAAITQETDISALETTLQNIVAAANEPSSAATARNPSSELPSASPRVSSSNSPANPLRPPLDPRAEAVRNSVERSLAAMASLNPPPPDTPAIAGLDQDDPPSPAETSSALEAAPRSEAHNVIASERSSLEVSPPETPINLPLGTTVGVETYNPPYRRSAPARIKPEERQTEAERLFADVPETNPLEWLGKLQAVQALDETASQTLSAVLPVLSPAQARAEPSTLASRHEVREANAPGVASAALPAHDAQKQPASTSPFAPDKPESPLAPDKPESPLASDKLESPLELTRANLVALDAEQPSVANPERLTEVSLLELQETKTESALSASPSQPARTEPNLQPESANQASDSVPIDTVAPIDTAVVIAPMDTAVQTSDVALTVPPPPFLGDESPLEQPQSALNVPAADNTVSNTASKAEPQPLEPAAVNAQARIQEQAVSPQIAEPAPRLSAENVASRGDDFSVSQGADLPIGLRTNPAIEPKAPASTRAINEAQTLPEQQTTDALGGITRERARDQRGPLEPEFSVNPASAPSMERGQPNSSIDAQPMLTQTPSDLPNPATSSLAPDLDLGRESFTPPETPINLPLGSVSGIETYNPPNRRAAPPRAKPEERLTEAEKLFADLPDSSPLEWLSLLQASQGFEGESAAVTGTPTALAPRLVAAQPSAQPESLGAPPLQVPAKPLVPESFGATGQPRQRLVAEPLPPVPQREQPVQLSSNARKLLGPITGIDPNEVTIRRDAQTEALTQAHRADALAVGNTVLLSTRLATETPETLGVIAHELTHVARGRQARFVPPALHQGRSNPGSLETLGEEGVALQVEGLTRAAAQQRQRDPPRTTPVAATRSTARASEEAPPWAQSGLPSPSQFAARLKQTFGTESFSPAPTVRAAAPMIAPVVHAAPSPLVSASPAPVPMVQAAAQDRDVPSPPSPEGPLPQRAEASAAPTAGHAPKQDLDELARQIYAILKRRLITEQRRHP